jgi:hypothetical protein
LLHPKKPTIKDSNKTKVIVSKGTDIQEKILEKEKDESNTNSDDCDPNILFSSVSDPLKSLLKGAQRESKFVINGLSRRLRLTLPNRHGETKKLIENLKKERSSLSEQKKKHDEERGKIKRALAIKVRNVWPELKNLHHPTVTSLYRMPKANEVIKIVDSNGSWTRYKELSDKSKDLERERFLIEKKEVLAMRLIREVETIVLLKNLPLTNPPHIVGRYEKIKTLEGVILPDEGN